MGNPMQLSYIWEKPEFLESLRLCMNYGYMTPSKIVDCVDSMISKTDIPSEILIELSLAKNSEGREISLIINDFVGDRKPKYAGRILLSLLYQDFIQGKLGIRKVAEKLYKYSLDLVVPEKELFFPFDYQFYMADNGIAGFVTNIEEEVIALLKVYSDYHLDNFVEWENIHEKVNKVLHEKFRLPITLG